MRLQRLQEYSHLLGITSEASRELDSRIHSREFTMENSLCDKIEHVGRRLKKKQKALVLLDRAGATMDARYETKRDILQLSSELGKLQEKANSFYGGGMVVDAVNQS